MPGPTRDPRFALFQALHFMRDPEDFARRGTQRHGDPFITRWPTGALAVTGDYEAIREIFTADPATFEAYPKEFLEPVLGTNSMFLLSGDRHKRERKLLMPPFHGERMRAYGTLMRQITLQAMEGAQPGTVKEAEPLAQSISMEVIIRAVFGVEEPERVRRFAEVLTSYSKSYTPAIAMLVPLRRNFGGVGPWARFQRKDRELDALLTEQIERGRADTRKREDILALLLSVRDEEGQPMSDQELKDELRTLLGAGYETTTTTMAWALYWLHRLPEVKQRLDEELGPLGPQPELEALVKLPYLGAVCDETLRMHPVAPVILRKIATPFTLRGHELPVGMGLMASVTLAHSHPAVYPEPERFRPERFLERKYSPFEYMPFGGGARRCLGAAFALYQLKVVLGTLLARYRFSLLNQRPIRAVFRNVTVVPSEPIPLRYEGPVAAAAAAA